jgi:hypothetical protein
MLYMGTLMLQRVWRVWHGRWRVSMFWRWFGFDLSRRGTKYIYIGGCQNLLRWKGSKVRGWDRCCSLMGGVENVWVNGCTMRGHGKRNLCELGEFSQDIELQVESPVLMFPGLSIRRIWCWRDRCTRGWQGFILISWESCLINKNTVTVPSS